MFSLQAARYMWGRWVFKKPVGCASTCDSNQGGLVLPGLPASPKPGLNRAGLVDSVFFVERHFGSRSVQLSGFSLIDVRTNQGCRVKQRGYYTIGIRFVYSLSVIVTIRHRQHRTTGRPRGL